MPSSEAVTIVVALASPIAAGTVAVLIHRQRLLTNAAWRISTPRGSFSARVPPSSPGVRHGVGLLDGAPYARGQAEKAAAQDALETAVRQWETYADGLSNSFSTDDHAVDATAEEVRFAVMTILTDLDPSRTFDVPGDSDVREAERGGNAARDVARARP